MGMNFVGIDANRNCYSPDQVESCTVGELISYLSDFDEDMPIYLINDRGYTYGSISYEDIGEHYINDDGELDKEDVVEESHKPRKDRLYIKDSKELVEDGIDVMDLFRNVDSKNIDHWQSDLYVRKTPETTKIIDSLPSAYKKNVSTFRDQIDYDVWYEIPFVWHK